MNIRPATLEDINVLAELNADVQRLHANALPYLFKQPDHSAAIIADFRERIFADVEGRVLLAEIDGEAAGYVYARVNHRPDNAYTYAFDTIHIDQISVRPIYQGQGFGRALVQVVFDWARAEKIDRVTLATWAFNIEAQAFFKKQGFEVSTYWMGVTLQG
jgi:diamine N-acetyltransferase